MCTFLKVTMLNGHIVDWRLPVRRRIMALGGGRHRYSVLRLDCSRRFLHSGNIRSCTSSSTCGPTVKGHGKGIQECSGRCQAPGQEGAFHEAAEEALGSDVQRADRGLDGAVVSRLVQILFRLTDVKSFGHLRHPLRKFEPSSRSCGGETNR